MRHELVALRKLKGWIDHKIKMIDDDNHAGVNQWEHYKFNVGYLRAMDDVISEIIHMENQLTE